MVSVARFGGVHFGIHPGGDGILATWSRVPVDPERREYCIGGIVIPRRFPDAAELRQALGGLLQSTHSANENEVYLVTSSSDIRPIVLHLQNEYEARIVAVFA